MKNYLNFETDIKSLESEIEKLKDPFNQSGLAEVDTVKISKIQNDLDEKLKSIFRFNFNLDKSLQNFFQGISNKISEIKEVIQEEREKQKQLKTQAMEKEKVEVQKRMKFEQENELKAKAQELKEEIKLERERNQV